MELFFGIAELPVLWRAKVIVKDVNKKPVVKPTGFFNIIR